MSNQYSQILLTFISRGFEDSSEEIEVKIIHDEQAIAKSKIDNRWNNVTGMMICCHFEFMVLGVIH